ncbi:MAG: hypothetical protein KY453_01150 [Gemmatimonadetes bacterium]|nr:hypothetical protein [Gemmatimonadota bacterium]
MSALLRRVPRLLLAAALWSAALPPGPLRAQEASATRAQVDSLLLHTELPSFTASVETAFGEHFLRLSTNLTTLDEVRDAASRAFADSLIRRDVAAYLVDEAEAGRLETLLGWLAAGAAAEMRAITDTTPLPQGFDEFVDGLEETPPRPRRVELVRRWAEARRAGDFVLLLDEAQREAAHRVAAAVDAEAAPFVPIGEEEFGPVHAQITAYSVLSFLHRLQPVPDRVLEGAIREYESEPGQWFVETYSLALAHAVREASRRIVDALGRPGA